MSNIAVVERESELAALPQDVLLTRLDVYSKEGAFTGRYAGPGRGELGFERGLARLFESSETPRLSGIQIKAPMYLDEQGALSPSTRAFSGKVGTGFPQKMRSLKDSSKPFTHILKPAASGGFEALPIIEWLALSLGRACGFYVPSAPLVAMPDGMPPALVVERFDIRYGPNDKRKLALEDMCSVLDLPTAAKYDSTMERVARGVRPLSTAPEDDLLNILKRALFAWLIADGDMHLKNMGLLKIAEPGENEFKSVRMAPLYDAVTTRVFPRLQRDHIALKLNGKDDKLRRADFQKFAATAGIKTSEAAGVIDELLEQMKGAIDKIALPLLPDYGPNGEQVIEETLEIARSRLSSFG
jgi:serine/threonine-protein kinase HipA